MPAGGVVLDVEQLYRDQAGAMVALARLLVDDHGTAEEVVQDAFAGLCLRLRRVGDPQDALAYLRRSVINGARSRLRRRRTERLHVRPHALDEASAEDLAMRGWDASEVARQLARLPRRQREVLVLRYSVGVSEQEIAVALGISRGSVKTHASRGLAALTQRMEA